MDINGMIRPRTLVPGASPVVRAPAPVSRNEGDVEPSAPDLTMEVKSPRDEERVQPVRDVLAAEKAAKVRGGTRLSLDKATERIVAQIVNKNNEVIKQIPPQEVLRIAAQFRRVVGLIFDMRI